MLSVGPPCRKAGFDATCVPYESLKPTTRFRLPRQHRIVGVRGRGALIRSSYPAAASGCTGDAESSREAAWRAHQIFSIRWGRDWGSREGVWRAQKILAARGRCDRGCGVSKSHEIASKKLLRVLGSLKIRAIATTITTLSFWGGREHRTCWRAGGGFDSSGQGR